MAELILGPMLRYVSATEATVWMETNSACEVEILGRRSPTFHVGGRHYALVVIRGLAPGSATEYEVSLDGVTRWPEADSPLPPSRIQTLPETGEVRIAWGSCRVARPHHVPYVLDAEEHPEGVGVDALDALTVRLREQDPAQWPCLLLLIGDQIYADEVSPRTLAEIRRRRDTRLDPGEEVLDPEEYAMLYREAWSEPEIRWLLSTIPSAMMFDDHDIHDDWNTSESWIEDMRATDWWHERILAGLSTYWIYQHIGNLSPDELEADALLADVRAADDAAGLLRAFADDADRHHGGHLWAFSRQIAGTRLVMLDSREGRVLEDGRRQMIDHDQFAWLERELTGDFDHVLVGGTLPVLLAPTLHWVEAFDEAVCDGAWGDWARRPGEWLRRALDLEHWAAFQDSFHRLIDLVIEVGSGRRGAAPASIVLLGGDVHQGYLEHVGFRAADGVTSAVYQGVCSPFRNQLGRRERRMLHLARTSTAVRRLARALAHGAGVRDPAIGWQVVQDPTWRNQLGWLVLDGRRLELCIETTPAGHEPVLNPSLRHRIA